MKKVFTILVFCFIALSGFSQTKTYFTSGGEMIFSFANITQNGVEESSLVRWAPFFNVQSMYNVDFGKSAGIFTGLAIRNVGYINENYKMTTEEIAQGKAYDKKKYRTYNLAIPVGLKLGNLGKMFFYGGYEVEFPFHYKEKSFEGGDKVDKITGYFSPRVESIQHGFLAGIQFPYGANLKFKYYLSSFHKQDYTDDNGYKPYKDLEANIFYFSLSTYLFKNFDVESPKSSTY
jgi:hypothetical protein